MNSPFRPISTFIRKNVWLGCGCLALATLGSCVTVDETPRKLADHWNRFATPPWVNFTPDANGKREFVFEGIAVKDYEYKRYTELIRRGVSYGGFGAQAASIGLNAAGALTTSGTTKILSGAAGAITGTSAAFNKNVLFDQSITTFIAKMDALRTIKLEGIKKNLEPENIGTYSLAEAYRDVEDYGHQGTLDAAFADIAKQSGVQQAEAKGEVKRTSTGSSGH
jgi:hypothetical protein